jgi:hypothetical protein
MIANDEGCGKWGDGPNQQVRDFARLFYNESKAKEEEETNSLGTPFEELDVNDQMNMLVAFFGQHEDIRMRITAMLQMKIIHMIFRMDRI